MLTYICDILCVLYMCGASLVLHAHIHIYDVLCVLHLAIRVCVSIEHVYTHSSESPQLHRV